MLPVPESAKRTFASLRSRLRRPSRRGLLRALAIVPLLALLYVVVLIPFTPAISDIRKAKSEQPAQVFSADGKELAVFKRANREWVPLETISPHVIAALIATEDHRFYDHHGIDWLRTASALINTFSGDRQGGSTITQQLARNLYPDEIGRAPTLTRKIKEAITALKIEAVYSKNEILETYLNTVPFLYNAFGIEMAARTYFDSSADELDVLQSATLIGMLKGNSYYNPVLNPERSLQRRNTVLAQMVKRGRLDASRFEALKGKPLRLEFERQSEPHGPAPHFAQHLRKWLIDWADRNDYNIYTDGLVVRTTIDSRLQTMANQAVERQGRQLQAIADRAWRARSGKGSASDPTLPLLQAFVRELPEYEKALADGRSADEAMHEVLADNGLMQALRTRKTRIEAGFLALDPRDGTIKAWVGSRDYDTDAFDHVQQARRQPGSTFKPFVYGAAFQNGAKPDDTLPDEAIEIPLAGGEIWRPTDAAPPSGEPMSLRDGLAYSKNIITARLMQQVGPKRVASFARALGVRQSPLETVPSLALGTSPVTLKEMVAAYGTMANGGHYIEPTVVTRIEDSQGHVLEEFAPAQAEKVLSPESAYTLVDVLRGVVNRGTGTGIRSRFAIRADVAGKTGTTQDNADGWFILMHRQLVAGAWVGFNDSRVTLRSDYWGQGAHSALPIVGDVFHRALRARLIDSHERFVEPEPTGFFAALSRYARHGYDWIAEKIESLSGGKSPVAKPHRSAPVTATEAKPTVPAASTTPTQSAAPPGKAPPASPSPATPGNTDDALGEFIRDLDQSNAVPPEAPETN